MDLNIKMDTIFKLLKFELLDRFYSVSDIQDYFEYILKKH